MSTLGRHLKQKRQKEAGMDSLNLVAVEVCEPPANRGKTLGSGLVVALSGGMRIEVDCGFDACTLAQLVGVLERR